MLKKCILIMIVICLSSCVTVNEGLNNKFHDADLAFQYKDYSKAMILLEDILNTNKDYVNALWLRGIINLYYRNFDKSIIDFKHIVEIDSNNYTAYFNLGNIYLTYEELDRAIYYYSSAIDANSLFDSAYLNRANTYMKMEKYSNALKDYKKYLTLSSSQKENIEKMVNLLEKKTFSS